MRACVTATAVIIRSKFLSSVIGAELCSPAPMRALILCAPSDGALAATGCWLTGRTALVELNKDEYGQMRGQHHLVVGTNNAPWRPFSKGVTEYSHDQVETQLG